MAPRTSARLLTSSSSTPTPTTSRALQPTAQPASTAPPQLLELRRQWKWAALSQFLLTFAPLIALEDITIVVRVDQPYTRSTGLKPASFAECRVYIGYRERPNPLNDESNPPFNATVAHYTFE